MQEDLPEKNMSKERYTLGYGPGSIATMSGRTAENHAGFFVSMLSSGMRVLDIGCGPGTVTLGIAEKVHPGQVIGTELSLDQTKTVKKEAEEKGLNLSFEQEDVYSLSYSDKSFDAVFMSAVVGNLQNPSQAITEIFRVLKPGGLVAIKEFDHSANISFPATEFILKVNELYNRLRIENGHDPDSGRKVRGLLNAAGFEGVKAIATYQNMDAPSGSGSPVMESILRNEWGPEFINRGWITQPEVDALIEQSQAYAPGPDFFNATAWIEAWGRRPG